MTAKWCPHYCPVCCSPWSHAGRCRVELLEDQARCARCRCGDADGDAFEDALTAVVSCETGDQVVRVLQQHVDPDQRLEFRRLATSRFPRYTGHSQNMVAVILGANW